MKKPPRARLSDVAHVRVTYRATALCGGVDGNGCPWRPFAPGDDRETRRQAREHVASTPGHEVVVTVPDVARYYLPDALVASLTPAESPAGGDDQPAAQPEPQED